MLNFDNIEDLVFYMFVNLDSEDNIVSVIADKEMIIEIMHQLLSFEDVFLNSCLIDYNADYDKEYIISLSYNEISDNWYVNIEKSYLSDKGKYISSGGYVLFHEDVNSKAMIDMQNNEFMPLGEHDLFVIGEEDFESKVHDYMVNGKHVDKKTFDKYVSKFAPDLVDKENDTLDDESYSVTVKCSLDAYEASEIIKDMERRMIHMNDILNEMNCFRRLLN